MKKRWYLILLSVVLFAASASTVWKIWSGDYWSFTITWSGNGTYDVMQGGEDVQLYGEVTGFEINPKAYPNLPTDLYDLKLNSVKGHDLMQGEGQNQTNASTGDAVRLLAPSDVYSTIALVVENAGTTAGGTVVIFGKGGVR